MNLQDFVDGIKRDSQEGGVATNDDQAAKDILRQLNIVGPAFWELNPWRWGIEDISFTITAGRTTPKAFASTIGELIYLGISGVPGDIDIVTEREYRKWIQLAENQTASIRKAVERGRDSSGNLQVLFVPFPSEDTAIVGEGKKRLATASYSTADIGTSITPNFGGYFPSEVEHIIYDWTLGRFLRSIKDARGDGLLASVGARVETLKGTQRTQPIQRPTTPPPAYIRYVNRKRGKRTVV